MQYLDVRSLLALSVTCRLMHCLVLDRVLWISLLQRDYWKSELIITYTIAIATHYNYAGDKPDMLDNNHELCMSTNFTAIIHVILQVDCHLLEQSSF